MPTAAPWYMNAVFYEALVRSFQDSDADGMGDLQGMISRLDHLEWLGVDCLWIPPIFASPLRDGGYDVADFYSLQPELGTLDDLADLIAAAHRRGIRVISDLVLNHTSDAHTWFQEARIPGSDRRDWYVWSDTDERYADTRIIFLDTEDSNWTWDEVAGAYYWHRFYSHQPDLNFDNPKVQEEMLGIVRHWLDFGFDGFRLDATPYLFEREGTNCENLPETHQYLKRVRALVDEEFPEALLLSEANQWPRDVVGYFGDGDECHMNFHFPLMPRLYMALARGRVSDIVEILEDTPDIPEFCQWATFLRNHDELTLEMVTPEDREFMWDHYAPDPEARLNLGIRRRMAPLVDGDRGALELLHGLLLSLPGSPVLYYGDEIGMGDDISLPDRDGVRTAMQWEPIPGGGFSDADPAEFHIPMLEGGYGPEQLNVADQKEDPGSFLNWLRTMLQVRKGRPELGRGTFDLIGSGDTAVLAFLRTLGERTTLVVANVAHEPRRAIITHPSVAGKIPRDVATGEPVREAGGDPFHIELDPLGFVWLDLE